MNEVEIIQVNVRLPKDVYQQFKLLAVKRLTKVTRLYRQSAVEFLEKESECSDSEKQLASVR